VTGHLSKTAIGSCLALIASLALVGPAAADNKPGTDPGRNCIDSDDASAWGGYVNRCLDTTKADPFWLKLLGPGLGWINSGFDNVPEPSRCVPGRSQREDGWAWECVVKDGRHQLVKKSRWRQPVRFDYAHTAAPTKQAVTLSANTSLNGCRLAASDARLLVGQKGALSGTSTVRTIDTANVPAGKYTLRVNCRDRRMNASTDLLVRSNRSALLRSDCIDAWHDGKYGDAVPGYGRRMSSSAAAQAKSECKDLAPITADEYQRGGRDAYLSIGQIAEREVRRVSAARGIPICQAITEVFKPADTAGHLVVPRPHPNLKAPVPIAGYRPDGFFPILYRQWQDGPVRMDTVADCTSEVQALRLVAGNWARCKIPGMALVLPDGHQLYPVYAFDRGGCPSSYPSQEVSQTAVCIVWGDKIGNNTIGGTGRVFAADASRMSAGEKPNFTTDLVYDCQDRALRSGQFGNVDVNFMPTLR
jgi:hypothetical protein